LDTPPLSGIRIVSFTQFLLGPAASLYLSDLGADVIKVERPSGAWERTWAGGEAFVNGMSVFFALGNRGSRSVCLDLKNPAGLEAAWKIIDAADVLIENFRPGVMDSVGLSYEAVHARRPSLVYASGSGYGRTAPAARRPGQDLLLQAATGLASITGTAGTGPMPSGAAVIDQHSASLLALGVLAALIESKRTGFGRRVEVSMLRAGLDLQMEPLTYHLNGAKIEAAKEPLGSHFHQAPYGIYGTLDGYVAISLSSISAVAKALDLTLPDELLTENAALEHRDEIYRLVAERVGGLATEVVLRDLERGGIWVSRVHDYESLMQDEALGAAQAIASVEQPGVGVLRYLRSPIDVGDAADRMLQPAPALGVDSVAVMREVGLDDEEIESLARAGAFGSADRS
jgi:crotonobetainyl-CoA:carnitine CoA-transferase CaiB-like acyl-CoA transferase